MTAKAEKQKSGDKTLRALPPDATLALIKPYFARLGITRVGRQTDLDRIGIPTWFACAPNAKSIVIAQGKGITDEDAQVSAAMEAVERVIASSPSCAKVVASQQALEAKGERVDTFPILLAQGQQPFSHDETVQWAEGLDVLRRDRIYVPFDAAHLDRTLINNRYWISSDGLASGNTREEALLHGLLERVERDAFCLWQLSSMKQRQATLVNPAWLGSDIVNTMEHQIIDAGLALRLFDISSDNGVPCFCALIGPESLLLENAPARFVEVTLGCGAHISPVQATLRAITEAAQSRLTYIAGARDDLIPSLFEKGIPEETRRLFCTTANTTISKSYAATPPASVKQALEEIVERLGSTGIDKIYSVQLSPPDMPIAVLKVLAPQLENPPGTRRTRLGPRALSKAIK